MDLRCPVLQFERRTHPVNPDRCRVPSYVVWSSTSWQLSPRRITRIRGSHSCNRLTAPPRVRAGQGRDRSGTRRNFGLVWSSGKLPSTAQASHACRHPKVALTAKPRLDSSLSTSRRPRERAPMASRQPSASLGCAPALREAPALTCPDSAGGGAFPELEWRASIRAARELNDGDVRPAVDADLCRTRFPCRDGCVSRRAGAANRGTLTSPRTLPTRGPGRRRRSSGLGELAGAGAVAAGRRRAINA
jgi:hypothetical protein